MIRTPLFLLLAFAAGVLSAASPRPDLPDALPVCASPQQISPAQPLNGGHQAAASIAWNGSEFAVVWSDNSSGTPLKFRRYFADGTPAGPAITLPTGPSNYYTPQIVWNGNGYGITWTGYVGPYSQIYFARLDAFGTMIGGSLQISFYLSTVNASSQAPSLAWSGNGYVVVWNDYRNSATTGTDIYLTELDANGSVAGSGARHDVPVSLAANTQSSPVVAWSSQAGRYLIFWTDLRSNPKNEIWGASLVPLALPAAFVSATITASANSFSPTLTDTGAGLGLSWTDNRDGNNEIYFARLDELGTKVGGDVPVTNDAALSSAPNITWTGAEFGIFWKDFRAGGVSTLWFQRVSGSGALVGLNQQVFTTTLDTPAAAFGKHGYLVEGHSNSSPYDGLVIPWGCGTDSTPPTCAGGYVAYSISGNNATVGWLPSDDQQSDIAYYNVYRNAALVGKTSNTYFNDSLLSTSTSYGYAVQPVNAWQLRNSTCTDTIYLTTNSSLTLTMNKSNPAAVLNWTDIGAGGYKVYRGNDPHVMGQIASSSTLTAQDGNALSDGNSYFYSVDE